MAVLEYLLKMFGFGEALKTNWSLFQRYSRWNKERRGGFHGNLYEGRPVM
jgi:hypothetical protein